MFSCLFVNKIIRKVLDVLKYLQYVSVLTGR